MKRLCDGAEDAEDKDTPGDIAGLVAADRVLAPYEEHSGLGLARTGPKCVQ